MRNRKLIYGILLSLAALAAILETASLGARGGGLRVVFLDVGQGDAVLISEGNRQVLIDGGKSGPLLLEKLGKHIPFWDRNIELVVETHPDQDHIGGLIDLFRAYKVEVVMKTALEGQSQTFKKLEEEMEKEGSVVIEARSGEKVSFPGGAEAEVIFPFDGVDSDSGKETNAASIVLKLTFGENSFLFTGDLPSEQEEEIILKKISLESDVLKVAHHGSKHSSSDGFLDAVKPRDAVVSVGRNNAYGHPSQEVLQKLARRGMRILRTDEEGDIAYDCQRPDRECLLRLK